MRSLVVLGALCVGLSGAGQVGAHHALAPPAGQVALSTWPFCDTFALRTEDGYSVARWTSGLWVFLDGDEVYGRAEQVGTAVLLSAGAVTRGRMTVDIEAVGLAKVEAWRSVRARCGQDELS